MMRLLALLVMVMLAVQVAAQPAAPAGVENGNEPMEPAPPALGPDGLPILPKEPPPIGVGRDGHPMQRVTNLPLGAEENFAFPVVLYAETLGILPDASRFVRLILKVPDREFDCRVRVNSVVEAQLQGKADNDARSWLTPGVLGDVRVKGSEDGCWVVSMAPDIGGYGWVQHVLAYSWLSQILPYGPAHLLSWVLPVLMFLGLVKLGQVFLEFDW